ncbi:MAG TPA: hypothetical protein VEM36_07190 [Xanthobacteraceae bacterium]|nr:hypothetical protein [Xanthobacteraceae bacterium]
MLRLQIALPLLLAAGLALAAPWTLPRGIEAGRALAARDDPARIADLALEQSFDAAAAKREIEAALAADDPELAQSFVELAGQRGIDVDPDLAGKVEADNGAASSLGATAWRFARGFVTGNPQDIASLAGTAAGDLFVFGDIRDAARETAHVLRGEEPNRLLLGLSLGGIAVTASAYASLGAAAPARVGLSLIKAAGKSERAGARLARVLRFERPAALIEAAGNVGRVQAKAGSRAALETLRLAEHPKDLGAFARLAAAKGGSTRAVVKLLGRGAIVLARSAFDLAIVLFWAVANVIGFCASLKRTAERATLAVIRRRKVRRLARRAAAVEAPAPA